MKKIFPGKELILKRNHPAPWNLDNFMILYGIMMENGDWYLMAQTPDHKIRQYADEYIISNCSITPDIQEFINKVKAAYVPPPKKCGDLTMDDLIDLCRIAWNHRDDSTDYRDNTEQWSIERNISLPSWKQKFRL